MTSNSDSFTRILVQFKSKLTTQEADDFGATNLSELEITIAAIQKRQASTRTMQNLTRLRGFLEVVQTYAPVVETFTNVHNFVAFIWGPIKYLLVVASNFADAFNALLDAYQRIAEALPVLAQYQVTFNSSPAVQQALETIFEDIFEFHTRALKYFKGNVWKQLFHATWKQFDSKFADLLKNMHFHKQLVQTHASLVEFQKAKDARELAAKKFYEQERAEANRRKLYLRGWLSAADVHSDQAQGKEARKDHPRSGKWLLSKPLFCNWFDPQFFSSSMLWITGNPGVGKTVLASLIIEEASAVQSVRTLFFYCRYGDHQRNSFVAFARSLIFQSLHGNDLLASIMFEAAMESEEVLLSTGKVAERLLETCLDAIGPAYIVVDGLDECPAYEQRHISGWLRKHVDRSANSTQPSRCVFLSQDDGDTRSLLSRMPVLRVTNKENAADIKAFCESWSGRIQAKFRLTNDEATNIMSVTANMAQGMFLFAKLVMSNLHDQTRRSGLDAELHPDVFPRGLEAAYDRLLIRILDDAPRPEREDAKRLLAWLVCALRPLKWREIQAAVSIDSDQEIVNYAQHQLMVDAKQLCGSLIEERPDGEVVLVHKTAKLYLTNNGRIKLEAENLNLAERCVEYLCFPFFEPDLEDAKVDCHVRDGSYAFMDYAIAAWPRHLENGLFAKAEPLQLSELETTLESFFKFHWRTPEKRSRPLKRMEESVLKLQDQDVKTKALQSMASMHAMSSGLAIDIKAVTTTDLFDVLYRIRERLELSSRESSTALTLTTYYGTKLFKCPKPYCKWFYEGFGADDLRIAHFEKHERPHFCSFAGCTSATLSFATKRELEEHVIRYHKVEPTENDFPDTNNLGNDVQNSSGKVGPKRAGEHICSLCSKEFSKASNLRAHERNHDDSNPSYACRTCDKSFRRLPDRIRHEKLHSGERKYVCLQKSHFRTEIGCGKAFSRSDQLKRHLASNAGQACRQAKLDDEAAWQAAVIPSIAHVHHVVPDLTGVSQYHADLVRYADSLYRKYLPPREGIQPVNPELLRTLTPGWESVGGSDRLMPSAAGDSDGNAVSDLDISDSHNTPAKAGTKPSSTGSNDRNTDNP